MHILIVGGAGVLGSAITPYLQADGHRITVLGPEPPALSDVTHIAGDATDFADLATAMAGVDAVVNFALKIPREPGADEANEPVHTGIAVNVGAVYAQLRTAARLQVPAFVQISSLAVMRRYGSVRRSAREPADAYEFYAVTKRMAEVACQAEADRSPGLSVTVLRLAYPTRAEWWPRWGNPVATEPAVAPEVNGRTFAALHPEDLARAIVLAAERRGPYLCTPVTADIEEASLTDQWPHPLGWKPWHVLGEDPEVRRDTPADDSGGPIFVS